jgi:hypothetical protein
LMPCAPVRSTRRINGHPRASSSPELERSIMAKQSNGGQEKTIKNDKGG